jgi:hypothetical protein
MAQFHGTSKFGLCIRARHHGVPLGKAFGPHDVRFCPVYVVKKGNIGASVRVIFNMSHFGRNAILEALKVNHAITTLCASTVMATGDTP